MSQRHYGYAVATGAGGFVSRRSPPLPLGSVGFEAKVDAKGGCFMDPSSTGSIARAGQARATAMSFCGALKVRSCPQGRGSVPSPSAAPILLSRDWPSTARPFPWLATLRSRDSRTGYFSFTSAASSRISPRPDRPGPRHDRAPCTSPSAARIGLDRRGSRREW
jgi:hypothetical protein